MKKICYLLSGVVSTILGIVCYVMNTGSYESSETYGGDAYTGIQNAAAQTANNVQYLTAAVKFGFGSVLLIAGFVLIIYALTSGKSLPSPVKDKVGFSANTVPAPFAEKEASDTTNTVPVQGNVKYSELEKYNELLNDGVISQEEFDAKKKQILGL